MAFAGHSDKKTSQLIVELVFFTIAISWGITLGLILH